MTNAIPRRFTVRHCLRSVAPRARGALISDPAWAAVEALAGDHPLVALAGFECRLNDDPQVDVSICLERDLAVLPDALLAIPVWRAARAVCEAWVQPESGLAASVGDLWFEFDLDRPGHVLPGVFLTFVREVPVDLAAVVERVADAIGRPPPPGTRERLPQISAALPAGGFVARLGFFFIRAVRCTRVEVRLPAADAPAFLARIGWQDTSGNLAAALATISSLVDAIKFSFDVGETVQPSLGVECLSDDLTAGGGIYHQLGPKCLAQRERWRPLISHLVDTGLCRRDKAAAILAWPGIARLPVAPDPAGSAPAEDPLRGQECCARGISHFKMIYRDGRFEAAKVYLGFVRVVLTE